MTTLANLPLVTWDPGNTQPDLLYNLLLGILDALLPTPVVADKDLTAPPGTPALGSLYIVGAGATGAWAGLDGQLVAYPYAGAWVAIPPKNGWLVYVNDESKEYRYNGSAWIEQSSGGGTTPTQSIVAAASDETTALTTGTAKITFRNPYAAAFTITHVKASLTTAQTSGSIFTVDINEAGASILSTKITIDNTEKTSETAVTAPVVSDATLAADAEITVDIDQIGDGTAKGLKVYLVGHL